MLKYSFSPISHPNATVLILGTMPGAQSLALQQYYGHPRNAFWKIIFSVLETPFATDYEQRKSILLENRIALWDVLEACVREGSLDSAIEQEVPNDFDSFLKAHLNIKHIYFNGQKAANFFKQHIAVSDSYHQATLPSTSPANAGMSFEKKLLEWEIIRL
ncbi:DNA-deoxyinosine glycosylase [Flavobacterium franklandianum]|uniref:DNA-deoxyinosine glycosylase n=1 Tax=Flavobacterium franklandianum TaxID=2594430 RepID=A0A553C608_9FLAO|nr:DNA-deoxyinosine glycosylase [Flavobacterium franklandianum]TRX15945.1 DNA-deoxyinosine glycosylase [Flavobacterium franklandianum]TRX27746.1 DNA-deoxyinosine glycosylase [Flavobacterium franklandianum]